MWPFVNVALQAGLGKAIHAVGAAGVQAAAMNLAGQGVIHAIAVAAGPVGWALTGASLVYGAYKYLNSTA
jgi:uncharacterized protein YaaW (UPF0174 family)